MHSDFRNAHYYYYYYYYHHYYHYYYIWSLRRSDAFCLLRGCKDLTLCHCSVVCRWLRTTPIVTHLSHCLYTSCEPKLCHIICGCKFNDSLISSQAEQCRRTDSTDIRETGRDNSRLFVLGPVIASQVISSTPSSFRKLKIYSGPQVQMSQHKHFNRPLYLERLTDCNCIGLTECERITCVLHQSVQHGSIQFVVVLQTLCGTLRGWGCSADFVWNSYRAGLFCRLRNSYRAGFCRCCVEPIQGGVILQTLCGTLTGRCCSTDVVWNSYRAGLFCRRVELLQGRVVLQTLCGTPLRRCCSADVVWNSYKAALFCRRCVELLQGGVVLRALCGTPTGRCCSADVVWNSYRAALFCRRCVELL